MTTTIPADDGFAVVWPCFGSGDITGLDIIPVVAWCIEGHADSGRIIPVTDYVSDEIKPGDVYALQHPDGSYHFPDGERCDSDDDLIAGFMKRREGTS